ncbi:MAG TPA: hypothetical protein VGC42_18840 [Kofleriaceae bacterium]
MHPVELTPENVEAYYQKCRNWTEEVRQAPDNPEDVPTRFNADEFQVLTGYTIRVAKHTSLSEFDAFLRTGELATPIKMTPAEMEVLMGGSRTTEWIGAVGAWGGGAVVAAGAAACVDA